MAKIHLGNKYNQDSYLEIRPWAPAGKPKQWFSLGGGVNFSAIWTYWVEVLHVINGMQVFYIRHFISDMVEFSPNHFEPFWSGKQDKAGFSDMFPETGFEIVRQQVTEGPEEARHPYYKFRLWLDTGILFTRQSEEQKEMPIIGINLSTIEIVLDYANAEQLRRFTDDFAQEIVDIQAGRHPAHASSRLN